MEEEQAYTPICRSHMPPHPWTGEMLSLPARRKAFFSTLFLPPQQSWQEALEHLQQGGVTWFTSLHTHFPFPDPK